jgi:hypothetical protein
VRLFIEPAHSLELKISWEVEETGSKAKIYGYDGVVLATKVLEPGEEPPVDPDKLTTTRLLTKNNIIERFPAEARGRQVACAACWQNEKGERGVWNGVVTVFIP